MKFHCFAALTGLFFILSSAYAQDNHTSLIFWKESFQTGKLPEGWTNVDVAKKGCEWLVTDQPYPGSFEYQQQAPPIASRSRGFHLQYQAGYIVDEDQPSWEKKKQYPDAFIQTSAINCSNRQSVVLRFQHTFRYNNYNAADSAGLYVGVSTDGIKWTDYNVQHQLPPATDMFNPINEEINISAVAADQPTVYLRFYWRGYYSWYWMIDDIELSEAYKNNVGIVMLTSHNENANTFTTNDRLAIKLKNTGIQDISKDFDVTCKIDDSVLIKVNVPASQHPFKSDSGLTVLFPSVDLTNRPSHKLLFTINYPDDNKQDNELLAKINADVTSLGNMTNIEKGKNEFTFTSGITKMKVIFYSDDVFRLWLAPDGEFTDLALNDIVINLPKTLPEIQSGDEGDYISLRSKTCVLRVYKTPLRFALYDKTNTNIVWQEVKPIVFGARTVQFLQRGANEYFYGCGMQNGYFSHRGNEILIEKGGGWNDGARPNPAPFYMSNTGYGVLRNTFDAGKYSFLDTVSLSHNEDRFDAFYFYGQTFKNILNQYTNYTGKPFLMPRWALNIGDANCYNKPDRDKKAQTTPDVIEKVADQYLVHDMPRGWILPNDGYGCGYVKLDSVVRELHKRGIYTGLWTENGVDKIATEVGTYGTRLCKLDVAWVGPGYKFALDACKAAYTGIENNSNARGYVWSVMGWAGSQRYSVLWSGDQYSSWEYIRFHIPTFIGSGLSAQNAVSSDIDAIFGGSDSTYVRDLQWKCFLPALMTMSGWAKKDKQPWIFGEPYTSINRKYLKLKMKLTPYMYTYCQEAYKTGVPATRALVLEYPQDTVTWGTQTQYQFLNGEWLLVAPVYKPGDVRDSIYFPKGDWVDYWTGDVYKGNQWQRNYYAPLDRLPLFVKSGAIIPMYPEMNYDGEKPLDTLTLDIYPRGKSSFNLYEDDGLTREHRTGIFATTMITVNEGSSGIFIGVDALKGQYKSMLPTRSYVINLHVSKAPVNIRINKKKARQYLSFEEWEQSKKSGYYYDEKDRKGILYIKTEKQSVRQFAQIKVN